MPSLKDVVEAMTASWPAALAIFVACAALLAADQAGIRYLETLPSWSLGAAFLGMTLSGSVLVVAAIQGLIGLAAGPIGRRRLKAAHEEHIKELDNLPQAEAVLLAWAIANETQVISAPYFDRHVKALVAKGFLIIPPGSHHTNEMPFYIPDYIWQQLKEETKTAPAELQKLVGLRPFDRW